MALVVVIVLPRVLMGLFCLPVLSPDSYGYIDGARALRAGALHEMLLYRTPGYAAFLALVGTFTDRVLEVVVFLQQLMGVLIGLLIFDTTLRLFKDRGVALFAATLYALNVRFILYGQNVMTEIPFILLVCLTVWLVLICRESGSSRAMACAAVANGLAVLLRPVALIYSVIPALGLATRLTGDEPRTAGIRRAVVFMLIANVLPGLWCLRNYHRHGFLGLSPTGQVFLVEHTASLIDHSSELERPTKELIKRVALREGTFWNIALHTEREFRKENRDLLKMSEALGRINREAILGSPWQYLKEVVPHVGYLLFGGGPNHSVFLKGPGNAPGAEIICPWKSVGIFYNPEGKGLVERVPLALGRLASLPKLSLVVNFLRHPVAYWVLFTLFIVGLRRMARDRLLFTPEALLLLGSLAYLWLFPCLTVAGLERYRLAGEPMVMVIAAYGVDLGRFFPGCRRAPTASGDDRPEPAPSA
ncbi:MAG: glycosyltransferase family 39 protein [Candidatus Riflebacteria bacterium]|nr:glycosyltransferase family 39 protein [Candidatus Riflebacteria bacterium]